MKKYPKILSLVLSAVMLICSLAIPSAAISNNPAGGTFLFTSADMLTYVNGVHSLDVSFSNTESSMMLKVNSSASDPDPYFSLDLTSLDSSITADDYKYIVITYRSPMSASDKATKCEVFLSAGSVAGPTAGKSVVFSLEKSNTYKAAVLNLSSLSWWNGSINGIRIDPYCNAASGDIMYIDSVVLCKTSLKASLVASDREENTYDASAPYDGTDYVCTAYDVTKYTSPLWKGNIVYNEAIFPIENADGSAVYTLMYTPDQVMSLCSSDFKCTYTEGVDFTVSGNQLTILQTGSIPLKKYSYIHSSTTDGSVYNYYPNTAAGDGKYERWGESSEFFNGYLNITYTHSDSWTGLVPENKSDQLPITAEKIRNGGSINIVYFGDSICGGANSSGYRNVYPYAEYWNQQISSKLSKDYNMTVNTTISAVGGSTSADMVSEVQSSVINYNPDLVFIEYGVNDCMVASQSSGYSTSKIKSEFKSGIDQMIRMIKASLPNCEIVLVSPLYSNLHCHYKEYFDACRDALAELADSYSAVVLADLTAMNEYMLTFKDYLDMSGNNMCHPNDFLARIYAQVCLETIVPGGVDAYVPKSNGSDKTAEDYITKEATPGGHGWYWSSAEAYGLITGYNSNGQDIELSCDLCLMPGSEIATARLWTQDGSHITISPSGVTLGGKTVSYSWGEPSLSNWHRVKFVIKNGAAAVYIDSKLVASVSSGITAYTNYQMLFSQTGEMCIDNLKMTSSGGTVYFDCDFENESAAKSLMDSSSLGQYTLLSANTVSYNLRGGSGNFPNQIKLANASLPLFEAIPTRDGYSFRGWTTDSAAQTALYTAGDTFTESLSGSATLYAVWKSTAAPKLISVSPASQQINDSGSVTFTAVAEGEDISYKWDCVSGGSSGMQLVNPDTPTLTVTVPEKLKEGFSATFKCTVSSDGGSTVSDAVTLTYTTTYIAGDINGDGKVNGKDLTRLMKRLADENTEAVSAALDVNGDGSINAIDINILMRYIAGADVTVY